MLPDYTSGYCYKHNNKLNISCPECNREAGMQKVVDYLGIYENDMGFCEISNHVPFDKVKEWGL